MIHLAVHQFCFYYWLLYFLFSDSGLEASSPQSDESVSNITVSIQGIELDYVCVATRTSIQNNKELFPTKNLVQQALAQSVQNQIIEQGLNQTPAQNSTSNYHQSVFMQNQALILPTQNEFLVQNHPLVQNQNPVQNQIIDQVLNQTPVQNWTTIYHQPVFAQNQGLIVPTQNKFLVQNYPLIQNQNPVQNQIIDQVLNQTPAQNRITVYHQPVFAQNQGLIVPTQNEFLVQNHPLVQNQNFVQNLAASTPNHDVMNEHYDVTTKDDEIMQLLGLLEDQSTVEDQPTTRQDPMLSSPSLNFQEPQRQNVQDVSAGVSSADHDMQDLDWKDVEDLLGSIESDGPGADDLRRQIRSKLGSKPAPVAKSEILEVEDEIKPSELGSMPVLVAKSKILDAEDEMKPSNYWTKVSWWGAAVLLGGVLLERFYF